MVEASSINWLDLKTCGIQPIWHSSIAHPFLTEGNTILLLLVFNMESGILIFARNDYCLHKSGWAIHKEIPSYTYSEQ